MLHSPDERRDAQQCENQEDCINAAQATTRSRHAAIRRVYVRTKVTINRPHGFRRVAKVFAADDRFDPIVRANLREQCRLKPLQRGRDAIGLPVCWPAQFRSDRLRDCAVHS